MLRIKGFWGSVSKNIVWVSCGGYKMIFATIVTNPLSPLPTNSPVAGFLGPPETKIYTILCCLRRPATLNPRTLSLRPQQNRPLLSSGNLLLVPGGPRKPQTGLRPSLYIPDRIGVETIHKCGLITSYSGTIMTCLRMSEASQGVLRTIWA